jgi:hypothetical protein
MATYNATRMAPGIQPKFLPTGDLAVFSQFQTTAGLATGDVINMMTVPAGAYITGVTFDCDKLDSNGSPTIVLNVGDGTNTQRFIKNSAIGQAGGFGIPNVPAVLGFQYQALTTILVQVGTGAATGVVGAFIRLVLNYSMDPT